MVTLRVDKKLGRMLERVAEAKGLTKSEIVRQSLIEYIYSHSGKKTHKIGKDVLDKHGRGKVNLSTDAGK
jgi:predicted transcriptional regulator